jgi:hypothetical protein
MTIYTWRGNPDVVTDPNAWNPTGIPGANNDAGNDVGYIGTGVAHVVDTKITDIGYFFGGSETAPPTLLELGHSEVTLYAERGGFAGEGKPAGDLYRQRLHGRRQCPEHWRRQQRGGPG